MAKKQIKLLREEVEIELELEEDDEPVLPIFELFSYPADFTLQGLYEKLSNGEIVIPSFQRRFVWTQLQSSRLIESFLLNLPVPPVFLYADKSTEELLVVDGHQRLKSIQYFFDEVFGDKVGGKEIVFRLRLNEHSEFNDKKFSDFSEKDQRRLKRQVLRSIVMKQVDPDDDSSILHVFERLNTGGTGLTSQEVRNCLYEGKFNDLLYELNDYPSWRAILGKDAHDKRLRDMELILRFLALCCSGDDYWKPLKDFLNKFMFKNRKGKKNDELKKLFMKTSDEVCNQLGKKPFHKKAGLNAAIYDSVFVAFAKNKKRIPKDIKERYAGLLRDEKFEQLISAHTTDVDKVEKRFDWVRTELFG